MRSRKDLAEDWLGDKDGILVFVRRTRLSPQSHIVRDLSFLKSVWTFLGEDNRVHHRRQRQDAMQSHRGKCPMDRPNVE